MNNLCNAIINSVYSQTVEIQTHTLMRKKIEVFFGIFILNLILHKRRFLTSFMKTVSELFVVRSRSDIT